MDFITVLMLGLLPAACAVQCMSSTGKPVDWYIIYKLPELPQNASNPILSGGYGHFYMDVNNPTWQLSKTSLNDTNHAIYYTLEPIYKSKEGDDEFLYVLYNDEDPNKKEPPEYGHSKGVLAADMSTGFWLVHSTPRFPHFKREGYFWPDTARPFGQSFLCISFQYLQLNDIAKQIMYNYVQVYEYSASDSVQKANPYLYGVIHGDHFFPPEVSNKLDFPSIQGTPFTSFAKTSQFSEELYSVLVAPGLQCGLYVETWQRGSPQSKLPSNCTGQFDVYNVQNISLPEGIYFPELNDHSKWAASATPGNWVCIGDINREKHQMYRGGGTVCFQNYKVWTQFSGAVTQYEHCH